MIPVNDLKRGFAAYQAEFEQKALDVLRSGWYVLGKEVAAFEEEFAAHMEAKYAVGVDNGLNAIMLGIRALEIGEGDEVIVAANTYIATVLGASLNRATPVFVDATPMHNMDPAKIEAAVTPRTKAVLVTHFYGQACEMGPIQDICRKHGLYLLEDCAQAHDAAYRGKKVGTFGTMGFFSFYPTKNLGAFGDAGAILTDDETLRDKLRALRNYGSVKRYQNDYEGFNSRLDELQAGLLRVRLSHLDELTAQRNAIARRYLTEIRNPRIELPATAEGCTHVYHLFVVQTDERDRFMAYLKENGVGCDVHYPTPPFLAKPYQHLGYTYADFPETERLYRRIVSIPIFNGMTEDEVDTVIRVVNAYE